MSSLDLETSRDIDRGMTSVDWMVPLLRYASLAITVPWPVVRSVPKRHVTLHNALHSAHCQHYPSRGTT
jgi:hypothetical protein